MSERWITVPNHPAGGKRKDLFGFVDVVAIGEWAPPELGSEATACGRQKGQLLAKMIREAHGQRFIAIQATSGSNGAARVKKIQNECSEALAAWLAAGGVVEVWAWKKYAKPVDRKFWRPRIVRVTLEES